MKKRPPPISEHAVLRYLQRVKGMDVDAIRAEMLSEGRAEMIRSLPNCKLPLGSGLFMVVVDGRVVTVSPRRA